MKQLLCGYDDDISHPWKCSLCERGGKSGGLRDCEDFNAVDSVKSEKPRQIADKEDPRDHNKKLTLMLPPNSTCNPESTKNEEQLVCGSEQHIKLTKGNNIKLIKIKEGDERLGVKPAFTPSDVRHLFTDEWKVSDEFMKDSGINLEMERKLYKKVTDVNKVSTLVVDKHHVQSSGNEYFDFRKNKREFIEPGLSPKYAKNWGVVMSLREFIANAIDVTPDDSSVDIYKENGNWVIDYDTDAELERKHFMMGEHEEYKTKEDVVGQFGEGIKVAATVLGRKGINIKIEGIGTTWYPIIEKSEQWGGNPTLRVYMVPNDRKKGTKVTFTNIDDDEMKKAKKKFLRFRDDYDVIEERDNNQIIKFKEKDGNKIALRNLIVKESPKFLFSYNFNDKSIQDRDREKIEDEDLKFLMKEMLKQTENEDLIRKYITRFIDEDDHRYKETSTFIFPENIELWRKIVEDEVGAKKIVVASNEIADLNAYDKGYEVLDWGAYGEDLLLHLDFKSSDTLKGSKGTVDTVKISNLNDKERENLKLAKEATRHLIKHKWGTDAKLGTVKIAKNFDGVESPAETLGLYREETPDVLYLHRKILQTPENATGTMIHEFIHKEEGVSDRTRDFERVLTDVSGLSNIGWTGTEKQLKLVKEGLEKIKQRQALPKQVMKQIA